jgi:hypothetical protein
VTAITAAPPIGDHAFRLVESVIMMRVEDRMPADAAMSIAESCLMVAGWRDGMEVVRTRAAELAEPADADWA